MYAFPYVSGLTWCLCLGQDAGGRLVHMEAIKSLCAANLASLDVNYQHLSATFPILAFWLADAPLDMLDIFDEVGLLLFLC
jgi:DNA replication licensing factor MCM2